MIVKKQYYEAYDDRYKQVHAKSLRWFSTISTKIVEDIIEKYNITKSMSILEIGCGEGRDAIHLLNKGYNLLATDISPTAISYCKEKFKEFNNCFTILNCLESVLYERFNFIFAISVLHMLVLDTDRNKFYKFVYEHLEDDGIALICIMGDGIEETTSDISTAFDLQYRIHDETGEELYIAGTSFRKVNFSSLSNEIAHNNLKVLESGITSIEPDFPKTMFVVVEK